MGLSELFLHCRVSRDHSCDEGWRSKSRDQNYSIPATQELFDARQQLIRTTGNAQLTFGQCSGAKIQTEVRFSANDFTPFHELVSTKLIGFRSDPGKFGPVLIVSRLCTRRTWSELIGRMTAIQKPSTDHLEVG